MKVALSLQEPHNGRWRLYQVRCVSIKSSNPYFLGASIRPWQRVARTFFRPVPGSGRILRAEGFAIKVLVELLVILLVLKDERFHLGDSNASFDSVSKFWIPHIHRETCWLDKGLELILILGEPSESPHEVAVRYIPKFWVVEVTHSRVALPLLVV